MFVYCDCLYIIEILKLENENRVINNKILNEMFDFSSIKKSAPKVTYRGR